MADLARAAGTTPVVAELLLRAGQSAPATAGRFLQPTLATLGDPFLLANLEPAVDRLLRALRGKERVTVLGDYDVDGVCSTAILVSLLRRLGLEPAYVVPRRLEEGYGLTRTSIERALEQGKPDLFIALDCGTNSHEEVALLRARGIDVIVVDHHRSTEPAAAGALLVNPHVNPTAGDDAWRADERFTDSERLALQYAEAVTATPPDVDEALFSRLQATFTAEAIVELTAVIAFQNMSARFNAALQADSYGFCKPRLAAPAAKGA